MYIFIYIYIYIYIHVFICTCIHTNSDPTSDCNMDISQPVLKPWPTVSSAAPTHTHMLYEPADHSGAYYCT
jgi:hypothetical protein